jgi:hypothetical protein
MRNDPAPDGCGIPVVGTDAGAGLDGAGARAAGAGEAAWVEMWILGRWTGSAWGLAGATGAAGAAAAAPDCRRIWALASSKALWLQLGQFTFTGIRPFTGSTSKANFVPQGHKILMFMIRAWGSAA